ncbi:MAG: energy-converting hydrogenase B subunit EhbP [Methanobacteriaceae archaeon]|nr:energy-converting hydrogenase B subunit EhbP [Methanobacteriaceae archaeon]
MKVVLRPHHMISLAGYIVELRVPFRNLIVVNTSDEEVKLEVPVLTEDWIEDHRALGLDVTPVYDNDNFLAMYQKAKMQLEQSK